RLLEARVAAQQGNRPQTGLLAYLWHAQWRHMLSVPFIYLVAVPLGLLDLSISLYQLVCFPLYRIARVRRKDFFLYDRGSLAYLNVLEKFHCQYCAYATGLLAYAREVVGRTEQYWCPIKHAGPADATPPVHAHVCRFIAFGDADAYRRQLEPLRKELVEDNKVNNG
ncbi:MAG: hypothetical protein RSE46_22135, partial [Janthinobacterium sp.]